MDTMAVILFGALVVYLAVGLLTAIAFVTSGVTRVQSAPLTIGARILLIPGAIALWPLIMSRWLARRRST
jgi:hypothetical protein